MALPITLAIALAANMVFTAATGAMYSTSNVASVLLSPSPTLVDTYLWTSYVIDNLMIISMAVTGFLIRWRLRSVQVAVQNTSEEDAFTLFCIRLGIIVSFCVWLWVAVCYVGVWLFIWQLKGKSATVTVGLAILFLKFAIPIIIFWFSEDLMRKIAILMNHRRVD